MHNIQRFKISFDLDKLNFIYYRLKKLEIEKINLRRVQSRV